MSSEVATAVSTVVGEKLRRGSRSTRKNRKTIIQKAMLASQAREAARKAREAMQRKGALNSRRCRASSPTAASSDPGAVRAVHRRGRERRRLGQTRPQPRVPGDPAATRQDPERRESAASIACSASQELTTLITALGTSVGEDKDLGKLRYHKIVIMTDADVDGAHIRTLLLTFFFRHYNELFENGHVFIAQPPLYKVKKGKHELYLKNEQALEDYLLESVTTETVLQLGNGQQITGKALAEVVAAHHARARGSLAARSTSATFAIVAPFVDAQLSEIGSARPR